MTATATYWRARYASGGTSGAGSRGAEARAKAALIDEVIRTYRVARLVDLGVGDGYTASLVSEPVEYVGVDPAHTSPAPAGPFDLALSFDVLFHLVDDADYRAYLTALFAPTTTRVLVWSTDHVQQGRSHVLHRHWTPDIPSGWRVCWRRATGHGRKYAWLLERIA